jgi:E3 ubiquitin-protein ligase HECTD2
MPHNNVNTSPRKRFLREPHASNGNGAFQPPIDPKSRAKQQLVEHFQMEFRHLYGDADFLNSSFCSSVRPKASKRSLSEGSNLSVKIHEQSAARPSIVHHESDRSIIRKFDDGKPLPSVPVLRPLLPDSKSLLAGHLHDVVSSLADYDEACPIERSTTVARKSTYQTSPHVNYAELHAYHSVLHRYTLDIDYCLTLVARSEDSPDQRAAARNEVVHFAANLLASCLEVMFDLLAAARDEPTAPQGARYLLFVLATPWLLRPMTPLASEFRRWHDEQHAQGYHELFGRFGEEVLMLFLDQPPGKKSSSSLRDRIISLSLGRISNLPDTMQSVFARWFANMPVNIYMEIMRTVQEFNLAQIRQIPQQQRPNTEETKQLHDRRFLSDILGAANFEQFSNDSETLPWYSRRKSAWKLRASCQTLQLLVVANDIRSDTAARYSQTHPSDDTYRPFSVDHFYTPLLDPEAGRLDVALDFELWDSRRGKFTLCQYPFLLTLGTKVRILEYDNERRKKDAVRQEWHASKGMSADPYFHLPVRRNHVIGDSFRLIRQAVGSFSGVTSKKLRVHFEGEEAVDAGGPRKEWFLILTQELFNPELGMFNCLLSSSLANTRRPLLPERVWTLLVPLRLQQTK